jgi:hypothetical protein
VANHLENPDEGQGHCTHEPRPGVPLKSRLVREGDGWRHIGGVGTIDIGGDVWTRRCRVRMLYVDRLDECVKVT